MSFGRMATAGLLYVSLMHLMAGCATTPRPEGHEAKSDALAERVIGTWEYQDGDCLWRREFTRENRCILTKVSDGSISWDSPYECKDDQTVVVYGREHNAIQRDGRLRICETVFATRLGAPERKARHAILGEWSYKAADGAWIREYTLEGKCILKSQRDGTVAWVRDFEFISPTTIDIVVPFEHRLISNNEMDIHGLFVAKRVTPR